MLLAFFNLDLEFGSARTRAKKKTRIMTRSKTTSADDRVVLVELVLEFY